MNTDYPNLASVDVALIRASQRRRKSAVLGDVAGVAIQRHVENRLLDRRLALMAERDARVTT